MEQQGLNEALALYRASVRKSPALMMETVNVDSNRGVTWRGNSPYDKFASPETRAKVLESRMQEIAAFAQSRSIPVSNLYALAEAAMRTGKIPDLGQFGLAGDDAVATKQFLISNVLNIAGLEWTDYKGDPVVEEGKEEREAEQRAEEGARQANQKKLEARRRAQRMSAAYEESGLDPARFMAEGTGEGMRKGTQAHTGEYGGALGGRSGSGRINKVQLKVGKTKRRRSGKQAAEAGMSEYEAERQEDDISFDPNRYMAEGSTKAGGYPFAEKEKHYRGHSDAELNYAHKDALKAARASGTHDPHAEGWYQDDAATVHKELQRRRKNPGLTSGVDFDSSRYMSEEGGPYRTGGAPESANSSPAKTSLGGEPNPMQYERRDLLPKKIMAQLRKTCGDGIYGYTREDLFRLARAKGLLGTEEDVQVEHDYQGAAKQHGGKFVKYIQGNIGIYQFPSSGAAQQFAEDCSAKTTATPKVDGNVVFIDEPTLGEADGIVGSSTDSTSAGSEFAPNPTKYDVEDEILKGTKKAVKEDTRSQTDKILGIMDGDPRGDSWPKLGNEMARLLNLESDAGIQRSPRGFNPDGYPVPEPLQEMTVSAGMGGFIGGGMMGGMTGRTVAMPAYDDSYELPEDPDKRIEVLKKMLGKHGLKPVAEGEETYEPAPNSTEVPVVRSEDYDSHPSRFMKRR